MKRLSVGFLLAFNKERLRNQPIMTKMWSCEQHLCRISPAKNQSGRLQDKRVTKMALQLDARNLLPDGVHNATIEEIGKLFGTFQKSNRRMTLFAKLAEYVTCLRTAKISGSLIVDGSFVMGHVEEPEDIDVVLVLPQTWDLTADLAPYQYNLVSKRDVKRKFPLEVIAVVEGSASESKWTTFFQKVNVKWYEPCNLPVGSTKGLVRIAL